MTPACPCRTGSHVTGMDTQQADTAAVGMRETQRAIGSVIFDYLHVGNEHAGPKVAAILSAVETCRRLSIKKKEPNQPRRSDRNPRTKCGTLQAVTKEVIGIHVLLTRSLFDGGILRRLLLPVSVAKPTSAPVRF
jgi:hypothetical protein